MSAIYKTGGLILLTLFVEIILAQQPEQLPWQQRDRQNMKPLEYEYQREADVFWSKYLWRIIDTRQKMNKPFAYPPEPLVKIIHEAAERGDIKVYDPAVDSAEFFKRAMSTDEVKRVGEKRDTVTQVDVNNPDLEIRVAVNNPLSFDRVTKYRVKEIWFFDSKTSSMQVRILAIAPVLEDYDENGNYRGDMTMYWVSYTEIRDLLMKHEVFNPQNDWQRMSWDDLFTMRYFASYIYKESNVYDRNIQEYATGTDALLESDKIKQRIFEWEHDLWEY